MVDVGIVSSDRRVRNCQRSPIKDSTAIITSRVLADRRIRGRHQAVIAVNPAAMFNCRVFMDRRAIDQQRTIGVVNPTAHEPRVPADFPLLLNVGLSF